MRTNLFTALCALFLSTALFGQAKKPTIMVVPADVWCNKNGFILKYDNQGTATMLPDHKKALQTDSDLRLVIAKLGELMAERGFPLKDLEQSLKSLEAEAATDNMMDLEETPIDKLMKVAKCDIIMQIDYTVNQSPRGRSITFNLQGLDAYTNKQVAAKSGVGQPSGQAVTAELLAEAVVSYLDGFNADLMRHFDDMFANGREVTLRVKKASGNDVDMMDLSMKIEDWMSDYTVAGRFGSPDVSDNAILVEQVRIPLYDGNGKATDTRRWAYGLQQHLKSSLGIGSKLMTKGLGQASLVIGAK